MLLDMKLFLVISIFMMVMIYVSDAHPAKEHGTPKYRKDLIAIIEKKRSGFQFPKNVKLPEGMSTNFPKGVKPRNGSPPKGTKSVGSDFVINPLSNDQGVKVPEDIATGDRDLRHSGH